MSYARRKASLLRRARWGARGCAVRFSWASIDSLAMSTVDVSGRSAAGALRRVAGIDVLTWGALDRMPVEALVTGRGGGVSSGAYSSLNLSLSVGDDPTAVLENRRRVALALGAEPGDFVFCRQVHSAGVRVVTTAARGVGAFAVDESVPEADVLVTAEPGVVLAILAADCLPVVLYDPGAHVLGCVHAGWRGTVARACVSAVDAMAGLGARPERVIAGIGPGIGVDRYQVGEEVAVAVDDAFGDDAGGVMRADGTGRWLFDLVAANRLVLREAGVADRNVHGTPYVTGGGMFFSDREARPCGRLGLVARLSMRGKR